MKKIFFAAMAMVAVFASCSKNTDQFTNVPQEGYGPQVQITLGTENGTRAFFDDTAVAEPWEKEITALSIYVFDNTGGIVIKRTLTTGEIANKSARFSLPNSTAGTSCSFYVVANDDYGNVTAETTMRRRRELTFIDGYNGTFAETAQGRKRTAGFVMTGNNTATIAAAGSATTVHVTLKRTVAKIAVRSKMSDDFSSMFDNSTVVITSATIAEANTMSDSFYFPSENNYTAMFNYTHEQTSVASEGYSRNVFYTYEVPLGKQILGKTHIILKGYFDADGNPSTSIDRSDVEYKIVLNGVAGGEIKRNGYYRIDAVIKGLSGDAVTVNFTVADWETPVTQTVELGN